MPFPPQNPPGVAPPAAGPVSSGGKTLAQLSAMGTVTPTPGAAPPVAPPGPPVENPNPVPDMNAGPPAGFAPARPVVAPHASARSVGTHGSRSPLKRGNAPHGMTK